MVKIGDNNSITIVKGDSNFIMFRCLKHLKEVDRVVFNLTKDGVEIYKKNLDYQNSIISLEMTAEELKADKYKYNLKICFGDGKKVTVLREKEFIILEESIRC